MGAATSTSDQDDAVIPRDVLDSLRAFAERGELVAQASAGTADSNCNNSGKVDAGNTGATVESALSHLFSALREAGFPDKPGLASSFLPLVRSDFLEAHGLIDWNAVSSGTAEKPAAETADVGEFCVLPRRFVLSRGEELLRQGRGLPRYQELMEHTLALQRDGEGSSGDHGPALVCVEDLLRGGGSEKPETTCFSDASRRGKRAEDETRTGQNSSTTTSEVRIGFVSHRWRQRSEPDPSGDQLRLMLCVLKHRPALTHLWYDYSCLPQGQRSPAEEDYFQRCLASIKVFLGSPLVWFVPLWAGEEKIPTFPCHDEANTSLRTTEDEGRRSEDDFFGRGWCFAEALWGMDRAIVVPGVTELALERLGDFDSTRQIFLMLLVMSTAQRAREFLADIFATKVIFSTADQATVLSQLLSFEARPLCAVVRNITRGSIQLNARDFRAADATFRESRASAELVFGPQSPYVVRSIFGQALAARQAGNLQGMHALYEEAFDLVRRCAVDEDAGNMAHLRGPLLELRMCVGVCRFGGAGRLPPEVSAESAADYWKRAIGAVNEIATRSSCVSPENLSKAEVQLAPAAELHGFLALGVPDHPLHSSIEDLTAKVLGDAELFRECLDAGWFASALYTSVMYDVLSLGISVTAVDSGKESGSKRDLAPIKALLAAARSLPAGHLQAELLWHVGTQLQKIDVGESIACFEEALEHTHSQTQRSQILTNLANSLSQAGRVREATRVSLEALRLKLDPQYSVDGESLSTGLYNLARTASKHPQLSSSLKFTLAQFAVQSHQREWGDDHWRTRQTLNHLRDLEKQGCLIS